MKPENKTQFDWIIKTWTWRKRSVDVSQITRRNILLWVIGVMMTFYKTIRASEKPIKESEQRRLGRPIHRPLGYFWRTNKGKKGKEMMINVIGLFTLPSTWLSRRNEIKMCVEWDFPGKSCKNHDCNKE